MRTPNYSYGIDGDFLVIEDMYTDHFPTQTVTNGIEYVLKSIKKNAGTLPNKVVYRDTEGFWDAVIHDEGQFLSFQPLRAKTLEDAKRKYNAEDDPQLPTMPFTEHTADALHMILTSIAESPLPTELFDAFLYHYAQHKDLEAARFFAQCEWDC